MTSSLATRSHQRLWLILAPCIALSLAARIDLAHGAGAPPRELKDCTVCGVLRLIPAGQFVMGSPETEDGRTLGSGSENGAAGDPRREAQHNVMVRSFALGEHLVTKGEYAAFVRATHYRPLNQCFSIERTDVDGRASDRFTWQYVGLFAQGSNEPAVCVSAIDALAYTTWLSSKTGKQYRLPSEAEWEYAARAGTTTSRYWGDNPDDGCDYANGTGSEAAQVFLGTPTRCNDHYIGTSPVGSYKPNAFGLFDMLGNVWEVMADCWHPNYDGAPTDGSAWGQEPNCRASVLRGGSFNSNYTSIRSAARHQAWPSAQSFNYGIRVARDP